MESTGSLQTLPEAEYVRTSGMGEAAQVPPELLGRWNWGAFLMNWAWGIGNQVWQSLIVFVPIVGWLYIFTLGARGNEFAWRGRSWYSIEEFKGVQRKWAIAGVVYWTVIIGIGGMIFMGQRTREARLINEDSTCLTQMGHEVDCADPKADVEILKRVKEGSDCRDVRHSDVTWSSADNPEVLCARKIPPPK